MTTRFSITFDPAYGALSRALLISPSDSYIEVAGGEVAVRMSWAFRATFPRASVARASSLGRSIGLTRGVHGWNGRWLVNGAGDPIVVIDLEPKQRGWVMGFPVGLRQLQLSVDDPAAVAAAVAR